MYQPPEASVTHRVRTWLAPADIVVGVSERRAFDESSHRRAFGDRVRSLRRSQELTQEDLAERAQVHRSYLAAVETGYRNPTLDVITKIASGLNVPTARLFQDDGSPG